nr:hypothetical protein [Tanacetum cinerariifolium]
LRHSKLFEGFKVQLGEDLIQARRGGLRAGGDEKLPPNIEENPMFQCLGQYPTSVRVFSDPILFLAGLKPFWEYGQQRPAIMAEPSSGFGTGSLSVSVNTEPLKANEEPVIQPVKDKKYKTRGGSSRPPIKRKLAPGSSISRATRAKTCSSNDNAPLLTVSDDDDGRLSFFNFPCIVFASWVH